MVTSLIQDKGIVLLKKRIREKDLLFKIVTQNHGMLSAIAFSGATSRKRIGGKGEKFSTISFQAKQYPEYTSIEEITLINPHQEILSSIEKIALAEVVAEILLKSIPEGADTSSIFSILNSYLNSLTTTPEPLPKILFELLRIEGYMETPYSCKKCGKQLTTAYFVPLEGFLCEKCREKSNKKTFYFNNDEINYFRHLSENPPATLTDRLLNIWEDLLEKPIYARSMLPNHTR